MYIVSRGPQKALCPPSHDQHADHEYERQGHSGSAEEGQRRLVLPRSTRGRVDESPAPSGRGLTSPLPRRPHDEPRLNPLRTLQGIRPPLRNTQLLHQAHHNIRVS